MTTAIDVSRLRKERASRGWTQQEVCDQLTRLAWLRHRERVGVNSDMVAKWERGVKVPSRRYRELLALLYGIAAVDLVAPPVASGAVNSPARRANEDTALLTTLGAAADLLAQLGPAGVMLQPRMFDAWKDEIMQRRALLKLLSLAPAAGFVVADSTRPTMQPTPEVVTGLHELADRYQALYHSTAPVALMTPVVAHLDTVRDVLRGNLPPAMRRKLLVNRARVAVLAGRLAFFDLRDSMTARAFYNIAFESAHEAGDHLQAAAALGHTAFIPAADRGFTAAFDYLRGAASHVSKEPHGPMSSWLAAIESEMHTDAGSHTAALGAIDRARAALSTPGLAIDLPWFDYYDAIRLDGFAGYTNLRAGRFERSRVNLSSALACLPQDAVKQRAVFLCDLATAHLHEGDVDQACRVAGEAVDQLHRAGYATGSGRLQEFRVVASRWSTTSAVRMLDEQLAAFA